MCFCLNCVLVLLAATSMRAAASAAAISPSDGNDTPYGRDFFILKASFPQPLQFVDLNGTAAGLQFSSDTNRQAKCTRSHETDLELDC